MNKHRNYQYEDIQMLVAAKTIVERLKSNLGDLSAIRSQWTARYVDGLMKQINEAFDNYLQLDPDYHFRDATSRFAAIQGPAFRDLMFLKKQLESDFASERQKVEEVHEVLGYNSYINDALNNNQDALMQLLLSFDEGMTPQLKEEITSRGTSPILIERIAAYVERMRQVNTIGAALDYNENTISEAGVEALNAIYEKILSVCEIVSVYYQFEPFKKDQFTFSAIINWQGEFKSVEV
ncbi:hypothetical protein DMA11_07380 [Marinilabiliaceae bacterium JC017]|nr:hypothetical protein DMA11_07380 [Marinilabiliaceae bacterium JC017]